MKTWLNRAEAAAIVLLGGSGLLLSCYSIVSRYFMPRSSLDWSFEIVVFLVVWAVFLGAARLIGRDAHIRVDIVLRLLGPRGRLTSELFTLLATLAMACFLLWSGVLVVEEAVRWGEQTASSLHMPMWLYYLALPVGAALMIVRLLPRIVAIARGRHANTDVGLRLQT